MSDAAGREKPQTRRRKSLSDKQLAILEVIQRSIARHGYPPSMRSNQKAPPFGSAHFLSFKIVFALDKKRKP